MKNILVPVDFSDVTQRVVNSAEDLARAFGAKIWLLHCVHEEPVYASMGEMPVMLPSPNEELSVRFADEHRRLSQITASLRGHGIDVEMLFEWGVPTAEIMTCARRHQADLIVMGSHGHGAFYEMVFGSVTKTVLQHTTIPMLIVPSEPVKATEPIAQTVQVSQWEEPMATPY